MKLSKINQKPSDRLWLKASSDHYKTLPIEKDSLPSLGELFDSEQPLLVCLQLSKS